jgi:enoyl-[acyl-carrier protein] reductase / trans-2-enoyl-CoA reductase (NAD+)
MEYFMTLSSTTARSNSSTTTSDSCSAANSYSSKTASSSSALASRLVIKPQVRGYICVTSHPLGCQKNVQDQINYVKRQNPIPLPPARVLVIGASTGYGLASRIVAAFAGAAATVGVFFEKPAEGGRTASAGWYNSEAFVKAARREGLTAVNINGDAFSDEIKEETIEAIRKELGQVDLVVYSLASPRRKHPVTGLVHSSVLKTIGQAYTAKTLDTDREVVKEVTIEPGSPEELTDTVAVMGGEDWEIWMDKLAQAGLLASGAQAVAYSYIGPEVSWPVYKDGTIGAAKSDVERAAQLINEKLAAIGGKAYVSINQAVVTQASSAIPVVPLYISLLFKLLKERNALEGCIEQIYRLFATQLFSGQAPQLDAEGRIRVDDLEMQPEIQDAIKELWPQVTTENLKSLTDFDGYKREFLKLFGFGLPGINYEREVDPSYL